MRGYFRNIQLKIFLSEVVLTFRSEVFFGKSIIGHKPPLLHFFHHRINDLFLGPIRVSDAQSVSANNFVFG